MNEFRDPATFLGDNQAEEKEVDLLEYVQIVWKHKWSIIGLALFGGIWALFVAQTEVPIYRSTAKLLLEANQSQVINLQDVVDTRGKSYQATQIDILKSRYLAEQVINRLDLKRYPQYAYSTEKDGAPASPSKEQPTSFLAIATTNVKTWIWEQLSLLGITPAKHAGPPQEADKISAISRFMGQLSISESPGRSNLVLISFTSTDRDLAAKIPNLVAETYIENELEARLQMTTKASSWLMDRLSGLREKLKDSEMALQAYLEQEELVSVEGASDLRGEKLGSLSSQLNEAERQRYQIDLALNQIRSHSGNAISRLNSIPAIMEDSRFNSLRQQETDARKTLDSYSKRYGPKHPKMAEARSKLESVQNSLQSRLDLIVAGLEEERKILDANISNLKRQIGATTQEIQQIQRKGHEMSVLRREVETNQQLYDLFLSRFKETRETGELEKVNARVIDPSIPALGPISPNKQKIIATGTFIGVAIGLMIAFLLEMLDKTLKGPKELEKRLNISSLGAIPQLRLKSRRGETPLSHARKSPESFFSESIRTMRTGVLLSGLDSPRKIIVVTSSIPGEGKSTLAMSLANSIGDMEKVLLIDGDMRRPTIAKHWGLAKDAKGLSEFVSQTAKLAECVHHPVEDSKVYVMPSGSVPPNPLELLSSKRFETSLENLASTFNYIIIDSAPTLAVSDALVLSSYATGVIYVIKAMSTPYPMAKDGIKRLQKAKAHIVGGVLNALPIAGNSKGYSKYKYIGYYNKSYYGSYGYSKESRT